MSKRQIIMVLGAIVVILPFSSFPSGWIEAGIVICGLAVIAIAYSMGPKARSSAHSGDMPFVESKGEPHP
ncbi:MAG: hypothetical protein KGI45_02400 [Patescibacteria group bacterium]|nr:hypothetical protein [Patescibacteria group bacterium]MDE1940564.1 hypothetical protein [Patescibacteria group bacterium]MDE1966902.1 hypothetical protein [Patescibacteria group bacterium]